MRIGFISTVATNIGDDLIRQGIRTVLSHLRPAAEDKYVIINKHRPLQVHRPTHPARWGDLIRSGWMPGDRRAWASWSWMTRRLGNSLFDDCEAVIHCGMPAFWPGCARSEWRIPLWDHYLVSLARRIPLDHVAIGSAFPWPQRNDPPFAGADLAHAQRMLAPARLITTRDPITAGLCVRAGRPAKVLPCTSILAFRGQPVPAAPTGKVLINYMPGASHWSWVRDKEEGSWLTLIRGLIDWLRSTGREVAMLCHSREEEALARRCFPELPRHRPISTDDFRRIGEGTAACISTRFHAAAGMIGLGVPALVVAEDSRSSFLELVGGRFLFAPDADAAGLRSAVQDLLTEYTARRERQLVIQAQAWQDYLALLAPYYAR